MTSTVNSQLKSITVSSKKQGIYPTLSHGGTIQNLATLGCFKNDKTFSLCGTCKSACRDWGPAYDPILWSNRDCQKGLIWMDWLDCILVLCSGSMPWLSSKSKRFVWSIYRMWLQCATMRSKLLSRWWKLKGHREAISPRDGSSQAVFPGMTFHHALFITKDVESMIYRLISENENQAATGC